MELQCHEEKNMNMLISNKGGIHAHNSSLHSSTSSTFTGHKYEGKLVGKLSAISIFVPLLREEELTIKESLTCSFFFFLSPDRMDYKVQKKAGLTYYNLHMSQQKQVRL